MIFREQAIRALNEERAELTALAEAAESRAPSMNDALRDARTRLTSAWAGEAHPLIREQALETFARDLRQAWLTRAAEATSQNFRSPTGMQTPLTQTGSAHHFGYERDLRPDELEQKCHDFFAPPPAGWCVEHLMFSSGQAAMTATLILLDCEPGLVPSLRPMRVAHLGTYFETNALLRLFPTAIELAEGASQGFDAAIVEPVWCDGSFSYCRHDEARNAACRF